jgi:demethylmenaquinone methyltransferase/2-methoxy-6-polyprenyl-1,4-benzoquinol methylase
MSDPSRLPAGGSRWGSPGGIEGDDATAQAVRTMFAAVASRYDFLNHFLSLGCDILWRRATANALRSVLQRSGSMVLDLCCGTGDLAIALSRHSAGVVVGADFCHPMLKLAKRKPLPRGAVFFLEADALCLPFRDQSADAVTIAFGLRNLANYAQGIQEMRRVLKPGGLLAILEFSQMRLPLAGGLFRVYFHQILPRLGSWISGVSGPYQYLPDSVARFPNQQSLAEFLRGEGFRKVRFVNFAGGIAALHLASKVSG